MRPPGGTAASESVTQRVGGPGPSTGAALRARDGGPLIWGIVNVTPDSFYDGGRLATEDDGVRYARELIERGAHVVDVGGASSRPAGATYGAGAAVVSVAEELARVIGVVRALAASGAKVSIDTTRGEVARGALAAGASIVNDVSMGRDVSLLDAVAERGAELVLMHTRGDGRVAPPATEYGDVVGDVLGELAAAVEVACARGVAREAIWIAPGVGFAKTAAQSAALLAGLDRFVASGHRVLLGASRKSFLGALDEEAARPEARLAGSLAAVVLAAIAGVSGVRVHDVAETRQALAVAAIARSRGVRDA